MSQKTNTEAINFRINSEMILNLKNIARHVSYQLGEDWSYTDIIRCLLAENYPIPDSDATLNEQFKSAVKMCSKIKKEAASNGVQKIPVMFTSATVDGVTLISPYDDELQDDKP
jgi:hypothetical protein